YGTTVEQLASIAVAARKNAGLNPDAYYRDPITIDDVLESDMIADPLTKLQCCIRSDGGGAVVLTNAERAKDCASEPIWVLGTGEAVSHTTMSEWRDFTESPAKWSGELAFRRAGLDPEDVDIAQLYDAFTPIPSRRGNQAAPRRVRGPAGTGRTCVRVQRNGGMVQLRSDSDPRQGLSRAAAWHL
ncbi:MAG: hypothetical protein DYH08_17725, partial [Actinobacteria bacterium ATB1]|nr:hypothetical protein [Actinobacteria bacterium ATB1]